MAQIIKSDKGVTIVDSDITKYIPFADVVKFSEGSYNNKWIVRVAHKNGLYMMYSDNRDDRDLLISILEKGCGRRS
jgi:hypothetical protein